MKLLFNHGLNPKSFTTPLMGWAARTLGLYTPREYWKAQNDATFWYSEFIRQPANVRFYQVGNGERYVQIASRADHIIRDFPMYADAVKVERLELRAYGACHIEQHSTWFRPTAEQEDASRKAMFEYLADIISSHILKDATWKEGQ